MSALTFALLNVDNSSVVILTGSSLILGSIYQSANSIEEASEFIDMSKQFVEGSHKMGENIDEPDDIRDMVIKLLGIDPINRTIH